MVLSIPRRSLVLFVVVLAMALAAGFVAIGVPQLSPAARPITASAVIPAALNGHLTAKRAKGDTIQGSVTQSGRQGTIAVIAFSWEVKTPIDAGGNNSGKPQHKPFTFTKETDKSTPVLLKAWADNETLEEMEFKFYAPTSNGTEVNNITYVFAKPRLVDITTDMPNNKDASLQKLATYERVSLVYASVTVTWLDGGITFEDTWSG
ncbi:MAG: type secretion system secreted protein Hcp [Chloroflexota bacterium]|jgi:type VI secretion system secreted protein Hcp|nr:type secretion system secreted protein Hcp [Chloroflexota bacterium]